MLSILNFFLVLYKNGLGGFPFASPSPRRWQKGGRYELRFLLRINCNSGIAPYCKTEIKTYKNHLNFLRWSGFYILCNHINKRETIEIFDRYLRLFCLFLYVLYQIALHLSIPKCYQNNTFCLTLYSQCTQMLTLCHETLSIECLFLCLNFHYKIHVLCRLINPDIIGFHYTKVEDKFLLIINCRISV